MKTLDEVITELEDEGLFADALHYLKVLKDILDPLKVKKNTHEITCPQCNSVIAILFPESNEPLTMEEFSRMIDTEPIWCQELQEWYLFLAYDDGDNRIQLMTDKGDIETFDEDDLEKYPLYRRK